jgi:hypothetical protein
MMFSLAFFAAAQAAVFSSTFDIDELSDSADQVVIGEVSMVESRRVVGGIVTEVTVDVSETLLGSPETELTLTLPGGRMGGEALTVSGVPQLLVGHDLLLFLDDGSLVGFTRGIFFTDGAKAYSAASSHPEPLVMEEIRRTLR